MGDIVARDSVERLQAAMLELPQAELPTKHYFADGMYARELFRPAGTTIVGKVHIREHFYIVLCGEVTVVGETAERVVGPKVLISKPGTKRAVYAHTDAICMTVHRTPFTDLEDIERDLVEPDESSPYLPGNVLKAPALEQL